MWTFVSLGKIVKIVAAKCHLKGKNAPNSISIVAREAYSALQKK